MKRTTQRLVEAFPVLKDKVCVYSEPHKKEKTLEGLSNVESTFYSELGILKCMKERNMI
jgi:hypothetical protein